MMTVFNFKHNTIHDNIHTNLIMINHNNIHINMMIHYTTNND